MLAESRRVTRQAGPRYSSMSLVERPPDPREPGGLARVLSDALMGIASPYVRQIVAGVVLIALMVLVLPLAIVVFIVTSVLFYGVLMLLGTPTGALGAALGLTWFGGSLALIGWLCVQAWRRAAFLRLLTGLSSLSADEEPAPNASSIASDPRADSDTVLTRVAAADARHAVPAEDAGVDEPTSSGR
jgi:hypothetical protein